MKICFLQTGGTIDKDYPKTKNCYAFEISEPAVTRILEKIDPNFEYKILSILKKNSLDITEEDRMKICAICQKINGDKIVITHGTDTMIDTAKTLSKIKDKVIVLTGAMKPERFSDSDAPVNIGTAIGAINVLDTGIYIAMNGRIYSWNNVKRNPQTGQFVEEQD